MHLHDDTDHRAQQQQRGNSGGSNYTRGKNNRGNGNGRCHGGGSNTGRANPAAPANGTSSPAVSTPASVTPVIAPSTPVTVTPAPVTAPPTPVTPHAAPTPYSVIESPPSGIGLSFLAVSTTLGQLKFTTPSDCGASSHFVGSHFIESRMKDIVKLNPPATIVVAGHSTRSGVSMDTLSVRVTDTEGFLHEIMLPAINVPGLGCHQFLGGSAAFRGVSTIIAKKSYLGVGEFKIPLRKDTECPTTDYLDVELAPRGNYQKEAACPMRVISGYTISMGSTLAFRRLRSGAMGAVSPFATAIRPLIVTTMAAPGLPVPRSTVPAHGVGLINGGTMGAASASTVNMYFAAPTITPGLATATATASPAMPATAIAAVGGEHLAPALGTSEGEHLAPASRVSEPTYHAGRVEHRRDGSQFH